MSTTSPTPTTNNIKEFNSNLIMPCFDSLKLKVPREVIGKINDGYFRTILEKDSDGKVVSEKRSWKKESDVVGIRNIEIRQDSAIFELSSKLLLDDYHELINRNNIEKVLNSLRRFVEIDSERFLKPAIVLKCDVTRDVHVSKPVELYLKALGYVCSPAYERFRPGRGTREFWKPGKESDGHLVIYGKERELKHSHNKRFREALSNPDILLERFKNTLRFERRFVKWRHIRKAFGFTGGPYLGDVLQSNRDPILDLFRKIKSHSQPAFVNSKMNIGRIIKRMGIRSIARSFNHEPALIFNWIKAKGGTNSTKYRRDFRKYLEKPKEVSPGIYSNDLLDELERRLEHGN